MGFEPTTTTLATLQQFEQNNVNCGVDHADRERLHHWLHLIAESGERDAVSILFDAMIATMKPDGIKTLIEELQSQAEAVREP